MLPIVLNGNYCSQNIFKLWNFWKQQFPLFTFLYVRPHIENSAYAKKIFRNCFVCLPSPRCLFHPHCAFETILPFCLVHCFWFAKRPIAFANFSIYRRTIVPNFCVNEFDLLLPSSIGEPIHHNSGNVL